MAGNNGLATAVELAGGSRGLPEADQLDLLQDSVAPLPFKRVGKSGPKGGRPLGIPNKSTQHWRDFILARYTSPLIFLAECYSRTPRQLAQELELYKWHEGKPVYDADGNHVLDTGAAATLQTQAAQALAPYVHSKQPISLEVKEKRLGMLVIGDLGRTDAGDGAHRLPVVDSEEIQSLSPEPEGEVGQPPVGQDDNSQ